MRACTACLVWRFMRACCSDVCDVAAIRARKCLLCMCTMPCKAWMPRSMLYFYLAGSGAGSRAYLAILIIGTRCSSQSSQVVVHGGDVRVDARQGLHPHTTPPAHHAKNMLTESASLYEACIPVSGGMLV